MESSAALSWRTATRKMKCKAMSPRFDGEGKKDLVPYFKRINGYGWEPGASGEPRPRFGLELLAQSNPQDDAFVVEGEKAAATLQSLGYGDVTSLGGSQASGKSNWSALEGCKRVYIPPDSDEAGEAYAKATPAILASLQNLPPVAVTHLPNPPSGGDVVDWIQTLGLSITALRVEDIHALIERGEG
jgi:hypothetical protein